MKWIFGYGSLMWNPGFKFELVLKSTLMGWKRRIIQPSTDHRGTFSQPGRVATLVADDSGFCQGLIFGVRDDSFDNVKEYLDKREIDGYEMRGVDVDCKLGITRCFTYMTIKNENCFEDLSVMRLAQQIIVAEGESGENIEYFRMLETTLRKFNFIDKHVAQIALELKKLLKK